MKNIGHNKPPENFTDQEEKTDLEKLINDAGRVKLTNTIIKKYLNRKYNPENDKYIPVSVNDSEKIGMKARINAGGAISFYYSYTPKGKQKNGKRFNPVYYTLGNFPEMGVDAARRLTEDLKHAIKLGKDPKSILEERKAAKTLNEVIALWKEKILYKTNPPSKADIEQRLKNWIDLEAYDPGLIKVILNNKRKLSKWEKELGETDIDCMVIKPKSVFIGHDGLVFPCCFTASKYYGNPNAHEISQLQDFINSYGKRNISLEYKSLKDIIDGEMFQGRWVDSFNNHDIREKRLITCSLFCGKKTNQEYMNTKNSIKHENNLIGKTNVL